MENPQDKETQIDLARDLAFDSLEYIENKFSDSEILKSPQVTTLKSLYDQQKSWRKWSKAYKKIKEYNNMGKPNGHLDVQLDVKGYLENLYNEKKQRSTMN